ncbi:MAG: response regulator transcription factor [Anaerolineales bacterium]
MADPKFNVRYGLATLLEGQFDIEVVEEVANAEALSARIRKSCPDLLLLSWDLPGVATGELILEIRETCPAITILVLSLRMDEKQDALFAGADDFISKADSPEQLLASIRSIWQKREKKDC